MPQIPFDEMKAEFKRILIKKGCEEEIAELSARMIAEASLDGVYSHGVNRFPRVVEYIDKGYIKLNATPTKVSAMGGLERWDAHLGLGNVTAKLAMDRAIQLAHENGIGCVALGNANHWQRGGAYGLQAADAGCIGICWTNTQPNMPAWGAKDRRIGNNPFIMAIPHASGHVIVDAAMSQFSYGHMEVAKMKGEQLSVPGGYDEGGNISTDPGEIAKTWRVLPIGFWKGSALSIVLDLVATALAGGRSTSQVGQLGGDEFELCQVFIAIDAKGFVGESVLEQVVNQVLTDVRASEPVDPKQEVRSPGEKAPKLRKQNLEQGIPVDDRVWARIKAL
jgi:3-dehydro-L-gulonate 2-dehydrogenase